MVDTLTTKEQRVLDEMVRHLEATGRIPTHAELTSHLDLRSKNSVRQYYRQLERKGYVHREPYRWRGVTVSVPIVGQVACGKPVWAEADLEGYAQVDAGFVRGSAKDYFLLRAEGDSMDRATPTPIEAGDLLLVQHQPAADPGDIVVARIDGEATVKVFKRAADYAVLLPRSSNPEHRPIIVAEHLGIYGVVRKVFKRADLTL